MNVAKFSVKNPVLVNLLMIGLFIFGFISLMRMPTELNPLIDFNWVFITVPYPGAAPDEVESLIVDPIETEIQDIDKVDEIQSSAIEGMGMVIVKFENMSSDEFRELYTDLKSEVDKVAMPDEAEDPIFEAFDSGDFLPVITIDLSYTIPEDNAQLIADELESDLKDLPGVAKVQVSGLAEREIWVEVDPTKLYARNVTFGDIVMALKSRNLNVPGGNITFGKTEYLIRSLGEYKSIEQIENTIIRTSPGGDFVRVKDVARVNDTRAELDILSRTNGESSITFSISKKREANSIDVINDVKTIVKQYEKQLPDGAELSLSNDNSVYIMRVINILRNNAITGMILIIILLYAFLGGSNALLASLGIPISFFITFIFMNLTGHSLNGNTLFALVMVLGIVVDDAIIVIENCHRYRLQGYNSFEAATKGTMEVATPILSAIGTNIAAFLPLMLLPGIMGQFMRIIPVVFSLALLASLFEAFFLLPSHYADWTTRSTVYKRGEKKFFRLLRKQYGHLLIRVIRRRYWVFAVMVLVLILSAAIIPRLVGIEMFGEEDFDQFKVLIKCPEGTSLQETDRIISKFETEALKLPKKAVNSVIVNIGLYQGNNEWTVRKSAGQILVQMKPVEERSITTTEMMDAMREKTKYLSGTTSVEFQMLASGPPVGKPISVKLQGKYFEDIKRASLALQDSIRAIQGTVNVTDDFPPGKQEIRIHVDEEKSALYGFNTQYVAMNVRYAFDGVTATEYRDGDDEVDVVVKYDKLNRSSVDDVLNLKLTNMQGQTVALRDMVDFNIATGRDEIKRFDQKRTIFVVGEINKSETSLRQVNAQITALFPVLEAQHPDVSFTLGGEFDAFMDTFKDIGALFILSIILIFLILGWQFNSYSQPLVILTTVPFGLIGAMLGLLISHNPFSVVTMFGFVALAGIVVNDAIVLLDFINNRRKDKNLTVMQYWRSIINAGRLRLRPIILTSLTTISGLLPMAMGVGGQSEMWAPLANVILFGLLIATILTLFFIPCLIAILDDIKRSRKKARQRAMGYLSN